jgi:hypothetical protein
MQKANTQRSFLSNGAVKTFPRKRIVHAVIILAIPSQLPITIEGPLEAVFSVWSAPELCKNYPRTAKGIERVQLQDIHPTERI